MKSQIAANRSEHAHTNPQRAVGDVHRQLRPSSSPLYSAARLAHLTSERTHFTKGSKVMSSQRGGWCVCSKSRVCASSVPAHIIYQQPSQCVRSSACLCQRGFPFALVAQFHIGRGRGRWQSTRDCRIAVHAHLLHLNIYR